MRFTARRLIASLSVLGLLAAQSTAFAADEQKKVEFFEGKEFAGASESAKDDTTIDLTKSKVSTDGLSSIKVPYGYIVKLTEKSGHESILLSEGNYNDLGKFGWDNYAATAEVKHYSALEYELQAARVQKVKEVVSAREKELNTALRGDAIAQKTDVGVDNLRVEPVEGNHEEKTELIFTGNTRLTNTTDQKQTLTSQAFDFAESNTISATTTNSIGTSVSASATFNIPIVGSLNTTISTQYNFSKADTKSESKTVTYKIPSQSITLEPGQTVEVRARLEKVKTAGKVRLIGDVNGTESGYVNLQKLVGDIGLVPTPDHKLTTGLVYKWKNFEQKPYELSFSNQHVEGEGTYQAECGSNLYIDVVDVSTNKVQTVQANATETQGDRSANGSSKDAVELTANAGTFDMTT